MQETKQNLLHRLIEELMKLPGVGQKTAQRLAFFLIKQPKEEVEPIARAILEVKERLRFCARCSNLTEFEVCEICDDPKRDRTRLLVVEEPSILHVIEKTGEYRGLYHVLFGLLSPLDPKDPSGIRIRELLKRLSEGEIKEIIVATSPTIEGETTALYLAKQVKPLGIKVSRIAYGIPVGADLEYADEVTLMKSIEGRREL
jgi:recombination protein RecR